MESATSAATIVLSVDDYAKNIVSEAGQNGFSQLERLQEELEGLNAQARELEATIAANVAGILEA